MFDRYSADELGDVVTPASPSPTAAPTSTTPSPPVQHAPLCSFPWMVNRWVDKTRIARYVLNQTVD